MKVTRLALLFALAVASVAAPLNPGARAARLNAAFAARQPNIDIKGYFAQDKAQRGRTLQAAVVMDIPKGYHVNSNRPTNKYLVATSVKVDVGDNVKVSPITYPRAVMRSFSFSEDKDEQLSVYEDRAVLRFNLTIPAGFPHSKMLVKARVRYQSCSDEVCYPPTSRDVEMWIGMADDNESVKRANAHIFGGGKKG